MTIPRKVDRRLRSKNLRPIEDCGQRFFVRSKNLRPRSKNLRPQSSNVVFVICSNVHTDGKALFVIPELEAPFLAVNWKMKLTCLSRKLKYESIHVLDSVSHHICSCKCASYVDVTPRQRLEKVHLRQSQLYLPKCL